MKKNVKATDPIVIAARENGLKLAHIAQEMNISSAWLRARISHGYDQRFADRAAHALRKIGTKILRQKL